MRRLSKRTLLGVALLLAGSAMLGERGYRTVKGHGASVLVERAWARTQSTGNPHPPWPWADLHPVGELVAAGERRVVLSGATGESLAFGVGHVHGTGAVGGEGHCVLAGHRDGAFRFLQRLGVGDEVRLRAARGEWKRYRVREVEVVAAHRVDLLEPTGLDQLTLLTCYPFDTRDSLGLRWVVRCEAVPAALAANSVFSSR